MSPEQWFYVHTETRQRSGPVSAVHIRQLIQSGKLRDTDYVWKPGMANWTPLSEMKQVFVQPQPQPQAPASAFPTSDSDLDLGGLKLGGGFDLDAGGTGGIQVDFDLGESVAERHPYPAGGLGRAGGGGGGRGGISVSDHAGIGRRLVAYIIDGFLLVVITLIVGLVMMGPFFIDMISESMKVMTTMQPSGPAQQTPEQFQAEFEERMGARGAELEEEARTLQRKILWIGLAIAVLYGTLMEWCPIQGTLGKMALGLAVTDKGGDRAPILRIFVRNFVKRLPLLIPCFGYLILLVMTLVSLFTPDKQGVQDLVSGCLVERK
ncbi:MAG TPA: RDD family protein [Candidatus Hydrogenedentes bacterium]|nr:RDD family protein [Candidatus Hydrogenedentota bacterium]